MKFQYSLPDKIEHQNIDYYQKFNGVNYTDEYDLTLLKKLNYRMILQIQVHVVI